MYKKEEEKAVREPVTGFWFPVEATRNPDLTNTEARLFGLIERLCKRKEKCAASNAYLAFCLRTTVGHVQRGISKLETLGYIEQVAFDERKRVLDVTPDWGVKFCHHVEESNERVENQECLRQDTDVMAEVTPMSGQRRHSGHPDSRGDRDDYLEERNRESFESFPKEERAIRTSGKLGSTRKIKGTRKKRLAPS